MTKIADRRSRIVTRASRLMQALSSIRMVGTVATMGYCAIHIATTHTLSPMMFGGAVMFGAVVGVTATLLSGCLTSSRST